MQQRKWDELQPSDDFMFGKIMRNKSVCKKLLEYILDVKIKDISYPEEQKVIDISTDARSVRLDVYVEDDKNTVYNVEMQTTANDHLPKRSRYYQGMIDLNLIEKGEPYEHLKDSFVIFLCTFDLFKKGLHKYTFSNLCQEDTDISLGDKTTKIFLNTKGTADDVSEEMKLILDYFDNPESELVHQSDNALLQEIQSTFKAAKKNEEWRREYMTLLMRDRQNRQEGKLEGILEGKEEDMSNMLALGLSIEIIAKVTGFSEEKIREYQQEQEMKDK